MVVGLPIGILHSNLLAALVGSPRDRKYLDTQERRTVLDQPPLLFPYDDGFADPIANPGFAFDTVVPKPKHNIGSSCVWSSIVAQSVSDAHAQHTRQIFAK